MNIAVFASGRGTNFAAIIKAVGSGRIKAKIALLVCDNPKARAIELAKKAGIRAALIEKNDFPVRLLKECRIDLIVLAGFMRLLSAEFVRRYKGRIMNIHPSLLPAFKGTQGIKDAFDYGAKVTGVTVHFVDEKLDHGPIILQAALQIRRGDTLACLQERIHRIEHKLYPEAIKLFTSGKLKIKGRKVVITAIS
ncbi:MAG: phosphoribosylglycinamide formyltransferase [Candidatus Omnitrophota bacterium]